MICHLNVKWLKSEFYLFSISIILFFKMIDLFKIFKIKYNFYEKSLDYPFIYLMYNFKKIFCNLKLLYNLLLLIVNFAKK